MSTRILFRVAYVTAGLAILFGALAVTVAFTAKNESAPKAVPVAPVVPPTVPTTTTAPPTTLPPTTVPPTTLPPTTAPPATTPPVTAPPVVYETGSIEDMICGTFGDQCQKALSVVHCESRFNPGTVGAAGERGLFQIHPVHIPYLAERGMSWDAMFDPASNIAYAYDLYSRSGWGPWTCA